MSREKEQFIPANNKQVGLYVCGPTVYSYAHLGNARSVVVYDVLYRLLKMFYTDVIYVRNITDVDDKIINAASAENKSISYITNLYSEAFFRDMQSLYCLSPTIEPRATDHIQDMIEIIKKLYSAGHAYEVEGGVYFDLSTCSDYGKLSGFDLQKTEEGARVKIAQHKKNNADFVLWKKTTQDDVHIAWESPWGLGRPGWHVECTAMSVKYLGYDFDIHGGGVDLKFPHHENEIACNSAHNSSFARYWMHSGILTVNGEKMSKSIGNVLTVNDLLASEVKGEVIRYALLMSHYHKPLDWSDEFLLNAKKSLNKLYSAVLFVEKNNDVRFDDHDYSDTNLNSDFLSALTDDMNTPMSLAALHNIAGKINKCTDYEKKIMLVHELKASAKFLGLFNVSASEWYAQDIDADIELLIQERHDARQKKRYDLADQIREKLKQRNILLRDNIDGTTDWYNSD